MTKKSTSVQTTRRYIRMGCYYRALVAELAVGRYIRVGRYNQGGVILQRLWYFSIAFDKAKSVGNSCSVGTKMLRNVTLYYKP